MRKPAPMIMPSQAIVKAKADLDFKFQIIFLKILREINVCISPRT